MFNVIQRTAVDPRPWCAVVVSIIDFIDSVVLDGDSAFIRILFSLWYVKYRVFVGGLVLRTYICKKNKRMRVLKWVRKSPPVCPHCQQEIVFSICAKYFVFSIKHEEKCSHCHQSIKPVKEPIPFAWCVAIGANLAVIAFYFFVYFIEDNVGKAMLFTMGCGVLLFVILSMVFYKQISFERA